ncbi:BA75_01628T0 [Komagataella pastoris]|uniref:1,3-beta-glucan synthase n=1 Tax=Komagataella pastoris TaxID=4922 RepID=A0A1B2J9Z3_PICPA|nr:BA75_01628T0 [Komagataella pastoris]
MISNESQEILDQPEIETPFNEPYYSWVSNKESPLTKEEILSIFLKLGNIFGFQHDSVMNMYDHYMVQLNSRCSRTEPHVALVSLHSDYIGGEHSNYRKWYFITQLEFDPDFEWVLNDKKSNRKSMYTKKDTDYPDEYSLANLKASNLFNAIQYRWKQKCYQLSTSELTEQVALYLLIWGEANQLRFMPELICFIYKTALDFLNFTKGNEDISLFFPEFDYLDRVVTPLYNYIRDQQYHLRENCYVQRERDHNRVIGYDDVNQFFWYYDNYKKLRLLDKTKLISLPAYEWYSKLGEVKWEKVFYKTYKENRSWWHLATNFNRIWVIHLCMFWYYTCFNSGTLYTKDYSQLLNNQPTPAAVLSSCSLAGVIACLVQIIAVFCEWTFLPATWFYTKTIILKLLLMFFLFCINLAPSVYIFGFIPLDVFSHNAFILSIAQFVISIITVLFCSIQPLGKIVGCFNRNQISAQDIFTASYPKLSTRSQILSHLIWILIFGAKFTESYFFLTLSLRDPIRNLSNLEMTRCIGDALIGKVLCQHHPKVVLVLMFLTDLILFFLDTYLWYIIFNIVFSVGLSFSLGISVLSPWRNIFTRLPQRIYSKILSTSEMEVKYKPKVLISQIWNAVVISMYREHLLSVDHVHRLVYNQIPDEADGRTTLRQPSFFVSQDDSSLTLKDYLIPFSEAERRVSFFAQSLSTPLPEPVSTQAMPVFTVLVPHYGEKILFSLKEIIKEDQNSRLTLLEYLKQIYPIEWGCFVNDTKLMAHATGDYEFPELDMTSKELESRLLESKTYDLPFYCVGYKSSSPEYTLRTRIWASLRGQTLYRTVSGFMNYFKAVRLLHRVENPDILEDVIETEFLEDYLDCVARNKFHLIVSMQRYQQFSEREMEDTMAILKVYPDLKIVSLEKEEVGEECFYYSVLYSGKNKNEDGTLAPIYKVRLSGNPILGDGKSDNQNQALIFYRGEYIQVIDANQDNYLEECLKIRSVLAEFEEMEVDTTSPYIPGVADKNNSPVAIVGAREYIFSENSGVLGDVAAGKEQTFGTLFARTLAEIGGKLHYGHPDFLNAIFMTTRGGISKAQKGLHLNEDIYAGMNALMRGGRIKHCDYYQCGKGRDLGFGSILNFTTKIGAGMGEQMLSREYYYLGTQLPLDRFLSFYYAHPGFHINNLFIILSVQTFMLVLLNLGALSHESIKCIYDKNVPITDLQIPIGCYQITPVLDWVSRFVFSIFICFFISFAPLFIQELIERGVYKAFSRLFLHFLSLSPLFEVFVCQIYSNSLKSDLVFGGAKYISTGRSFAITRNPFTHLYANYAPTSIYSGSRLFLVLLFATLSMWKPALLWFWITLVALCVSPFIFNPHQFVILEFFLDYREYIRWLTRGNSKWHQNSWIGFTRSGRSRILGTKKPERNQDFTHAISMAHRTSLASTFFVELIVPIIQAVAAFIAYTFVNSQNGVKNVEATHSVIRIIIVTLLPIVLNIITLLVVFILSCFTGPIFSVCFKNTASLLAGIAHGMGLFNHVLAFLVLWLLENWNFTRTLAGLICSIFIQRAILQGVKILLLTRETLLDSSNRAWWSGKWIGSGLGVLILSQPIREFLVKIIELSLFAADFVIGHTILFAISIFLLVPFVDQWHSSILFWLKPTRKYRGRIYSLKQKARRRRSAIRYFLVFILILIVFVGLIVGPIVSAKFIPNMQQFIPEQGLGLFQPTNQNNNDTGPNAPSTIPTQKPEPRTWSTWA